MPWVSIHTDQVPHMTQADLENNVTIIYNTLSPIGYSLEAIAAICGNMQNEGLLNPGQYEIGKNYDIYNYGAGLCGWTPVYVTNTADRQHLGNWCDAQNIPWEDGDSQLAYMNYELTDWANTERFFYNGQGTSIGYPNSPPITARAFISSTLPVADLACYWLLYYEHPYDASASYQQRITDSLAWYAFLQGLPPPGPTPAPGRKGMPVWMMCRNKYKRR